MYKEKVLCFSFYKTQNSNVMFLCIASDAFALPEYTLLNFGKQFD